VAVATVVAVLAGAGVGVAQVLAPAARPDQEVGVERDEQAIRDEQARIEAEQIRLDARVAELATLRATAWDAVLSAAVDCGVLSVLVEDAVYLADAVADGLEATDVPNVVVLRERCDAGAGSPSTGIFVYGLAADRRTPELRQVVLDPKADLHANSLDTPYLRVGADRVTVELLGYSAPGMTRCCPDQELTLTWRWSNGAVTRSSPRPR
jgi:hypothetical protein